MSPVCVIRTKNELLLFRTRACCEESAEQRDSCAIYLNESGLKCCVSKRGYWGYLLCILDGNQGGQHTSVRVVQPAGGASSFVFG